ncbi:MAG: hypothetical protein WD826_07055 [Actinomycetota bacterium]
MRRIRPYFASDVKAIDEVMAPFKDADYHAVHDINLVTGQADHAIVGPSGVYSLVTQHSSVTSSGARKRAIEHGVLVRRQLAAGGAEWKVTPVVVLMWDRAPKGITELKSHSVVDLASLGKWVKGRPLRLEPIELSMALSAITPSTGFFK